MNTSEQQLRRIRLVTRLFLIGLLLSGATAQPLITELRWLTSWTGAADATEMGRWLLRARDALEHTQATAPFLFYGTDWLAFGHYVIALAFIGALRDPVRNRWLYDWGLMACVLVIPFAFVCGEVRGIPLWWRLIDMSFGVGGFIPLWFCRKWTKAMEEEHSTLNIQH